MKNKYLIVLSAILLLVGSGYFLERNENARLWQVLDENDANLFFPAISRVYDFQKRVELWQANGTIPKEELDLFARSLDESLLGIQAVVQDLNRLDGDAAIQPFRLLQTLHRIRTELSAMSRDLEAAELKINEEEKQTLQYIHRRLTPITEASLDIYGYESGFTSAQWKQLMEQGFLNDDRLLEWFRKVEVSLP